MRQGGMTQDRKGLSPVDNFGQLVIRTEGAETQWGG